MFSEILLDEQYTTVDEWHDVSSQRSLSTTYKMRNVVRIGYPVVIKVMTSLTCTYVFNSHMYFTSD